MTYTPFFVCSYCGEKKYAVVEGAEGVFVPCQCPDSQEVQLRKYYEERERMKQNRNKK